MLAVSNRVTPRSNARRISTTLSASEYDMLNEPIRLQLSPNRGAQLATLCLGTSGIEPKSVLDVGCGHGAWLKACHELGATQLLGLDGTVASILDHRTKPRTL